MLCGGHTRIIQHRRCKNVSARRHHYSSIDHLSNPWNYPQSSRWKIIAVRWRTWRCSYASTYVHIRCADFKHMAVCFSGKKKSCSKPNLSTNTFFFLPQKYNAKKPKNRYAELNRSKMHVFPSSSTHCFISLRLAQGSVPPYWACVPQPLLKSAPGGPWKCPVGRMSDIKHAPTHGPNWHPSN